MFLKEYVKSSPINNLNIKLLYVLYIDYYIDLNNIKDSNYVGARFDHFAS